MDFMFSWSVWNIISVEGAKVKFVIRPVSDTLLISETCTDMEGRLNLQFLGALVFKTSALPFGANLRVSLFCHLTSYFPGSFSAWQLDRVVLDHQVNYFAYFHPRWTCKISFYCNHTSQVLFLLPSINLRDLDSWHYLLTIDFIFNARPMLAGATSVTGFLCER